MVGVIDEDHTSHGTRLLGAQDPKLICNSKYLPLWGGYTWRVGFVPSDSWGLNLQEELTVKHAAFWLLGFKVARITTTAYAQ